MAAATPVACSRYAEFYRKHLLEDVMRFWERRTGDREHGGFLVLFDREGRPTGDDKYTWCQGRQTWMFAALYNHLEPRREWLELSRLGRDFLMTHAHAGNGRWYYRCDRQGRVLDDHLSLASDVFVLTGLAEHARASGSDEDLSLIRESFHQWFTQLRQPGFNQFHHFNLDPAYRWHGPHMVGLHLSQVLRPLLGEDAVREPAEYCLDLILHRFANDEHETVFEAVHPDGRPLDNDLGQRINPGHALESSWFCMEEGIHRRDARIVERAKQMASWAYRAGLDQEHDGLLAFTDPHGRRPPGWTGPNAFGEDWDSKIWWVHSEALYALALAAIETDDTQMWQAFQRLHDYTIAKFADPRFGEWYAYLHRDGSIHVPDKGTWIKSAFHIPRNLMKLVLLFERVQAACPSTKPTQINR